MIDNSRLILLSLHPGMNKLHKLGIGLQLLLRRPSVTNALLEEDALQKQLFLKQYALPYGFPYVQLADLISLNDAIIKCFLLEGGSSPADYSY